MHKLLIPIFAAVALLLSVGGFSAHAQINPSVTIPGQNYPIQVQDAARNNTYPQTVTNPINTVKDAITGAGGTLVNWIGTKGINFVLYYLSYYTGVVGSTLFTLAGLLVQFGLFLNTTILDSQVVQLGWRFCRDLANLGFTIGIVVIAYATMLGIESYGMKTLIKNFVVAAVLVNFSFSIAGAMIDGSNLLTNFFVSASIGGGVAGAKDNITRFGETLAGAFGPQRLLVTDTEGDLEKFRESSGGMWAATLSVFFVAFFTIFCALGMLSVGITMFWRFAHLSGLIIIMPLAVLASSFPDTKKHWGKWKSKFLCQLTHIPTLTFFLYLVIMFVEIKASVGLAAGEVSAADIINSFEKSKLAGGGVTGTLALMAKPFQVVTDMVLVLTMVFMSIIEARKVGCAAGDFAIKWMEGVKGWAIGTVQGAPGWAGRKYLSGGTGGAGPEENRSTRLANRLQRLWFVGGGLAKAVNNFAAGTKKNLGNFETEYKGMGDVQLRNALYNPDIKLNAERMAAAAKEAAARGLLSEKDPAKNISQEKFAEFIPALKRYGYDKDVLKKAPHLYGKFGLDLSKDEDKKKFEAAIKDFKPEDVASLPEEAFADPEIVSRFTSAHLEKLPKKKEYRDAFAQTFIGLESRLGTEKFGEFVAKSFAKPEADAALLPALLRNPLVIKNLTNANLKRLAGSDKEDHRTAFIETINDTAKISDKEFADFMRNNFASPKSIDEIHPEIIRNKRFFNNLNEKHIERMNKEPDENQQEAMIAGLRESYKYLNENVYTSNETPKAEVVAKLDRMAKIIIDKKNSWQWSPLVESERTKEAFWEIESEYRKRNPDENQIRQQKERLAEVGRNKKKNDDDAYGPPAPPTPPPPTKGPYPPAGGGPSTGNEPPKPPTPPSKPIIPKGPYPAGAGGPSALPKPAPEPIQAKKSIDIGAAMDGILGALRNDDTIEPTKRQEKQKAAEDDQRQLNTIQPETLKAQPNFKSNVPFVPPENMPQGNSEDSLTVAIGAQRRQDQPKDREQQELEAIQPETPQELPHPIIPQELNALAEAEEKRLQSNQAERKNNL